MNKTLKVFLEFSGGFTTWLMILWPTPGFWHNIVLEGKAVHDFEAHALTSYIEGVLWVAAVIAILFGIGMVFFELKFAKGIQVALWGMMLSFAVAGGWAHYWNSEHKQWEYTHIAETGNQRHSPPRFHCRKIREVYYNHEQWESQCEEF